MTNLETSCRKRLKPLTAANAIDVEIPVGGKDEIGIQFLREDDKCRVCKVHRKVRIFLDEAAATQQRDFGGRYEDNSALHDKIDAGHAATRHFRKKMGGFGKHRFSGHHPFMPCSIEVDTCFVDVLTAIQQSNERAGIEKQFTGHGAASLSNTPGAGRRDREFRFAMNR